MGSPYQTSLSEAGQDKFFYLVGRVDRETAAAEEEEGKAGVGMGAGAMQKHHQELLHAEARLGVASEGEAQPAEAVWKEIERWTVSIGSKIIKVLIST